MITGTYNLVAQPNVWKNVNNEIVYLKCNTLLGPVTINLCQIAKLNGFTNVKIFVNDETGNAATNNITINAFAGDGIDDGVSTVINSNNGAVEIQVADSNSWIALEGKAEDGLGQWEKIGTLTFEDLNIAQSKTFAGAKPVNKYIERVEIVTTQDFANPGLFVLPVPAAILTPPVLSVNVVGTKVTSANILDTVQTQGNAPQDLQLSFFGPIPTDWTSGAMDVYVIKKDLI